MKVLLREDVDDLGNKGDLLEVADGYARNYLVPRGLAIAATRGAVRQAEAMRRNREAREARARAEAVELAGRVTARPVTITARAGEGGKLFGSVTAADVAAAIRDQSGVELDRRKLGLTEPIKDLGSREVVVRLHADVEATIALEVVAE